MRGFLVFVHFVIATHAVSHEGPNDHAEVAIGAAGEVMHVRRNDGDDMELQATGLTSTPSSVIQEVAVVAAGEVMHVRRNGEEDMESQAPGHTSMASLVTETAAVGAAGEIMHVRRHEVGDMGMQDARPTPMPEVAVGPAAGEVMHMLRHDEDDMGVQDTGRTPVASLVTEEAKTKKAFTEARSAAIAALSDAKNAAIGAFTAAVTQAQDKHNAASDTLAGIHSTAIAATKSAKNSVDLNAVMVTFNADIAEAKTKGEAEGVAAIRDAIAKATSAISKTNKGHKV